MGAAAILLRVVVVGVAITVSMTACDGSPLPAGQVVFGDERPGCHDRSVSLSRNAFDRCHTE